MSLATFWRQSSNGTSYWRCDIPAKHLGARVLHLETWDISSRPGKPDPYYPRQKGVAIWQFPGNNVRALMMRGMRQAGFPVLVEVDDNYLSPAPHPIDGWVKEFKGSKGLHSNEAHRAIVGNECDGLIVSTPYLKEKYSGITDRIWVCPNSVDPDDWDDEPDKPNDGVLRIGWAASESHHFDAPVIRRSLEWASKQPSTEVVIYGLAPRGWDFRYTHVPWTDSLAEYRKSLSLIDVGVCPLKESVFNSCKSDIKAMEYAMAGAMPIVQGSCPAYAPWRGKAFHADTPKSWERAVHHFVLNPEKVKDWAEHAKQYVLSERTIADSIWHWKEAIESVSKQREVV